MFRNGSGYTCIGVENDGKYFTFTEYATKYWSNVTMSYPVPGGLPHFQESASTSSKGVLTGANWLVIGLTDSDKHKTTNQVCLEPWSTCYLVEIIPCFQVGGLAVGLSVVVAAFGLAYKQRWYIRWSKLLSPHIWFSVKIWLIPSKVQTTKEACWEVRAIRVHCLHILFGTGRGLGSG